MAEREPRCGAAAPRLTFQEGAEGIAKIVAEEQEARLGDEGLEFCAGVAAGAFFGG
jgi:hypothetical protein